MTHTHRHTHTSVAVPFEVIDGAHVSTLAALGLTHGARAGAFTALRTVFSHKLLVKLKDTRTQETRRGNVSSTSTSESLSSEHNGN